MTLEQRMEKALDRNKECDHLVFALMFAEKMVAVKDYSWQGEEMFKAFIKEECDKAIKEFLDIPL